MIDLDIIGKRIREQRKFFLKISQEKMAEDLNMYQADISNMEKAKSGSGIGDLQKLDLIAEYLNIPLETLIFGREDRNMIRYQGDKMRLKKSKKSMLKTHKEVLKRLIGQKTDDDILADIWECGPYTLYGINEYQQSFNGKEVLAILPKVHLYVFFGTECVGSMVYDITDVIGHVYEPSLAKLQEMIPFDILDVTDVWRTLNPYWALWNFTEDGPEKDTLAFSMFTRMDTLRSSGENRHILYIESAYVREDCRRNGIFRMMIDYAKATHEGCIMWLNMEPTSGSELDNEYKCLPSYSISDLGQLNLNAFIAEHVGFSVDPDTWHREAEVLDEDGCIRIETIEIRKCAYFLPKEIKAIISEDGDLVAKGRALQKLHGSEDDSGVLDFSNGKIGEDYISEIKVTESNGSVAYAIAIARPDGSQRYLITKSSFLNREKERILEEYSSLEEAEKSERYQDLAAAYGMLLIHLSNIDEKAKNIIEYNPISMLPCDEEIRKDYIIEDFQVFMTENEVGLMGEGIYAKMTSVGIGNNEEVMYPMVISWENGTFTYIINEAPPLEMDDKADPIVEIDTEDELEECPFKDAFMKLRAVMETDEFKTHIKEINSEI